MRKPDLSGQGEAWIVPNPEKKENGDSHATIRNWMVKGSWHPFWDHWIVAVTHLRDVDGINAAVKESPNMTHEFIILSLDPGPTDVKQSFDPDNLPFPIPYLKPLDCIIQFECASDAKAMDVCDAAVRAIIEGHGSPDQGFASIWKQVIPATAKCQEHDRGLH